MAEPVNLNPEVAEQLRRGRGADEVCIEKLLETWPAVLLMGDHSSVLI